jgi:hypothetical protein
VVVYGADINKRNNEGFTPLYYAHSFEEENRPVAKVTQSSSAPIAKNAFRHRSNVVDFLEEHGAIE